MTRYIDAFKVPADQPVEGGARTHVLDDTLDVTSMGHLSGPTCHCRPTMLTCSVEGTDDTNIIAVHHLAERN